MDRQRPRPPRAAARTSRPPLRAGGARVKNLSALALAAPLLLACAAASARAASLPAGFAESQIAAGLPSPTAMAFAPDGRVFVCLQGGQLRVVKNGALLPTPFLALTVSSIGERGLLGVAFDPNFSANRFVYVYYTATAPTVHNRVSRFTASASNPDVAEAGSEVVLLDLETLGATNHNGGAMHFGADNKLYVAVGENATPSHSQSYANKLGKILRINPDPANLIPADNPFLDRTTGTNRSIWALGLRNPYTFAVQPGTGRILINDVGQSAWEEINEGRAGANYGWPACEGNCPTPAPTPATRPPDAYTNPIFRYGHTGAQPAGCAITGGTFYNPPNAQFPDAYVGKYFFADFCTSFIRYIDPDGPSPSQPFAAGLANPVDLRVSTDGSLWYLERGNTGRLMRVRHTASSQPPTITQQPQGRTVAAGSPVTFAVAAAGAGPLGYQWQRNGADIPGANSQSYTINAAAAADDGAQFRAVVTNPFGSAASNAATLNVVTAAAPGEVVISEFRLDGPAGAADEFVELYNRTGRDITVAAADGSSGWALAAAAAAAAPAIYHVIPAGTVIPPRSRYLVAGAQYGLANYGGANAAEPDAKGENDLAGAGLPFRGLALFRAADPAGFTAENRLDAVGCAADPHPLLVEGAGAGPCHAVGTQAQPAADYSLVRRLTSGAPQDTDDNAADFQLVAVQIPLASPAAGATLPAALGAPGPENSRSPVARAAALRASLVQPRALASAAPNRVRDPAPVANGAEGTLSVRRRYTNKSGAPVTRLRFRITHLSTAGNRADADADLRALTSGDVTVTVAGAEVVLRGTALEGPPAQPSGGGVNSTLSADSISPASPLQPGQSVDLQLLFGVQGRGNFRLLVNVETLP
jgi:glucose/arabinose dehydrogenase